MYIHKPPKPLVINLYGNEGFNLREKAVNYVRQYTARGIEAGSPQEQSYGILAELTIRKKLNLPEIDPADHPIDYDIELPSNIKVDVKCRGGILPFQEHYAGSGDIQREAKHNFFARQVYDPELKPDIYLMSHLMRPRNGILPGTLRQRKWVLYICGWVSKKRVINNGVYLPRGSLTEQGMKWFPYRAHEIEYYHKHLNGLANLNDLLSIEMEDVRADGTKIGDLHLTLIDACRIAIDMVGRGIVDKDILEFLRNELNIHETIQPIFHPNQYYHLLKWLKFKNKVTDEQTERLKELFNEINYTEE